MIRITEPHRESIRGRKKESACVGHAGGQWPIVEPPVWCSFPARSGRTLPFPQISSSVTICSRQGGRDEDSGPDRKRGPRLLPLPDQRAGLGTGSRRPAVGGCAYPEGLRAHLHVVGWKSGRYCDSATQALARLAISHSAAEREMPRLRHRRRPIPARHFHAEEAAKPLPPVAFPQHRAGGRRRAGGKRIPDSIYFGLRGSQPGTLRADVRRTRLVPLGQPSPHRFLGAPRLDWPGMHASVAQCHGRTPGGCRPPSAGPCPPRDQRRPAADQRPARNFALGRRPARPTNWPTPTSASVGCATTCGARANAGSRYCNTWPPACRSWPTRPASIGR